MMFSWIWTFLFKGRIGAAWCSLMHKKAQWPIHGYYHCSTCGRRYRVPWADAEMPGTGRVRQPVAASISSAILPVLILIAALNWPLRGEERIVGDDSAAAAAVLQRFISSQAEGGAWPVETIDIQASLPKLKKTGSLRAIRTVPPVGEPDYQVLEAAGDPTVEHQVISRYISANGKASGLSASSVAVTPANYKFRYIGTLSRARRISYIFRMIPRRKKATLISGVIWIDSETGVAVRLSGCLAKSPSMFVKRIDLTQENDLDHGRVAARTTHVAVETRLAGRAQLVILEHPLSDASAAQAVMGAGQ